MILEQLRQRTLEPNVRGRSRQCRIEAVWRATRSAEREGRSVGRESVGVELWMSGRAAGRRVERAWRGGWARRGSGGGRDRGRDGVRGARGDDARDGRRGGDDGRCACALVRSLSSGGFARCGFVVGIRRGEVVLLLVVFFLVPRGRVLENGFALPMSACGNVVSEQRFADGGQEIRTFQQAELLSPLGWHRAC